MKYFSLNFVGQKPHECIECGKRFALGCNMKAHLKTHDPNRSNNSKRIEFDEDEEEELLNVTDWSRIYLISWRKRKHLSYFFLKKHIIMCVQYLVSCTELFIIHLVFFYFVIQKRKYLLIVEITHLCSISLLDNDSPSFPPQIKCCRFFLKTFTKYIKYYFLSMDNQCII